MLTQTESSALEHSSTMLAERSPLPHVEARVARRTKAAWNDQWRVCFRRTYH
jgi:hypothetical protein